MRLADPEALLLLLLVPPLLWWLRGRAAPLGMAYPALGDLARLRPSWRARLRRALPWLRALVLMLTIVALARPQWGVEATKVLREGIAIAMVIDVSSSMGALDLQIGDRQANRLDVVKETFRDFVSGDGGRLPGRDGDVVAMITFARYADVLSPLTLDHEALLGLLKRVELVPLPEEDGTAIGDGMVAAVERLRAAEGAGKVMILLTDGSHNAGDAEPIEAAQIAAALGIKIYTIGAGTRGIALMPGRNRDGSIEYAPGQVFIDEYTLERIAAMSGGRYFRATDAAALRSIYAEIDRLEKARHVAESYQEYIDVFAPVVTAGLALLLLEIVLVNTRLRTVP
ncbi:MAG: VWA domain-containing protein [Geminicoccaceae bacterium]